MMCRSLVKIRLRLSLRPCLLSVKQLPSLDFLSLVSPYFFQTVFTSRSVIDAGLSVSLSLDGVSHWVSAVARVGSQPRAKHKLSPAGRPYNLLLSTEPSAKRLKTGSPRDLALKAVRAAILLASQHPQFHDLPASNLSSPSGLISKPAPEPSPPPEPDQSEHQPQKLSN